MSKNTVKEEARLIKEATRIVSTRPQPQKFSGANKAVKDVMREQSNVGKNMLKLGTALLITPDPITSAAAVPILIGGKMLHARNGANVKEVYEELRKTLNAISASSYSSL